MISRWWRFTTRFVHPLSWFGHEKRFLLSNDILFFLCLYSRTVWCDRSTKSGNMNFGDKKGYPNVITYTYTYTKYINIYFLKFLTKNPEEGVNS